MKAFAQNLFLTLFALALSACASGESEETLAFTRSETAVDYEVELVGVADEEARNLLERALELYRQQDRGAQSLAFLRRRAQDDVETVQKVLRSFGWYAAEVQIEIDERAAAQGAEEDPQIPLARVIVTEHRRYTLAAHDIVLADTRVDEPSPLDAAALGSPIGAPAVAEEILQAEKEAVRALRADGRPYARRVGRDAVADPEAAALEVTTTIDAGGRYVIGDAVYSGAEGVDRDYLDTYRTWDEGEIANPGRLKAFQNELVATGLFDAASAEFPEEPPEGDVAPVEVRLEEAKPRTISGGVRYNTDVGAAVRGGFEHRNLFGANETVTIEALAGLDEQSLDTRYRIPQYLRPGQDLVLGLELRRIDDDAFTEYGGTFAAGIERELSDRVAIGYGGLIEVSEVDEGDGFETALLVGLPVFVAYDSSDDRLDPSKGLRARISATPFGGTTGGDPVSFGVLDATASTYYDLTGERDYILAVRGRLATILASDLDVVSPQRRLFSGGGGSVRGYEERFIGPLDDDGDPSGGLSAVELGAEMRARVTPEIGVVGFVEAGSVSEETAPVFDEGVRVAVGGGLRYFSPVGPLRFDIGFPVNGRDVDDRFQFYISIGQAF